MPNIKKSEYQYLKACELNVTREKLEVKRLKDQIITIDERRRVINEDSLMAIAQMVRALADTITAMNKEGG